MQINVLLSSLLIIPALVLSSPSIAQSTLQWKPPKYTVDVELPSCDDSQAVLIDRPEKLALLSRPEHRVFCIAPGDYRSAGVQEFESLSGRAGAPRVIRMTGREQVTPAEYARAPLEQIALLPPLYFRDSHHWVLDRLAFIDVDEAKGVFPLRFFASSDIVMNRLRVEGNRHGIEFHHLSRDITLQNSLIGDMDVDLKKGNDAVCVAFEGRYTAKGKDVESAVIQDIHVVGNEIYNCNDGVQLIWNEHAKHWPDFSGTLIAANDMYIDERRLTDCKGNLDPNGECACTENAIDLKAGAKSASRPVIIRHNRFYGWRKTDSICNKQAQSWGTAVGAHYVAAQNIRIEQNLFWNVVSGVSLTKKTHDIEVLDNLIHTVPKVGGGNGIGIVSYESVSRVKISRNRVVKAHKWLSLLSEDTELSCNIINASGAAMGVLSRTASSERNTYFEQLEPSFKSTGDVLKEHSMLSKDAELCTELMPLSGSRKLCLEMAASTANSPHACGAGYWFAN